MRTLSTSEVCHLKTVKIATRKSALAMWQAEFVKAELERVHPGITVELIPMTSRGDKILDVPLAKVGGKGLFVKVLEHEGCTGRVSGRFGLAGYL